MGSLTLPTAGFVYVDAQIVIYNTDGHPLYAPVSYPVWQPGATYTVSSELILTETLAGPLRNDDTLLLARRENLW